MQRNTKPAGKNNGLGPSFGGSLNAMQNLAFDYGDLDGGNNVPPPVANVNKNKAPDLPNLMK